MVALNTVRDVASRNCGVLAIYVPKDLGRKSSVRKLYSSMRMGIEPDLNGARSGFELSFREGSFVCCEGCLRLSQFSPGERVTAIS
jgi:hypothetical protein